MAGGTKRWTSDKEQSEVDLIRKYGPKAYRPKAEGGPIRLKTAEGIRAHREKYDPEHMRQRKEAELERRRKAARGSGAKTLQAGIGPIKKKHKGFGRVMRAGPDQPKARKRR